MFNWNSARITQPSPCDNSSDLNAIVTVALLLLLLGQQDFGLPPEEEVDLCEGGPLLLLARPALL